MSWIWEPFFCLSCHGNLLFYTSAKLFNSLWYSCKMKNVQLITKKNWELIINSITKVLNESKSKYGIKWKHVRNIVAFSGSWNRVRKPQGRQRRGYDCNKLVSLEINDPVKYLESLRAEAMMTYIRIIVEKLHKTKPIQWKLNLQLVYN